jgi:hypothetical protein
MKRNAMCGLRLLASLILFAVGASAGAGMGGGLRLMVQQIEVIGPRQWLGLVASSIVAAPVLAPVGQRIATRLARRSARPEGEDTSAADNA